MENGTFRFALVGNPNTGKSTLFNALTGLRQHVGNYPGVTVEIKKGRFSLDNHAIEAIDLPGTYSLAARSPDEMLSVDLLLGHIKGESRPDVIVSVVDANNLPRHLFLASQLFGFGVPVVIAVNFMDVARKHGVIIDFEKIRERLGVAVVPIQANRGQGIDELKRAILSAAKTGHAPTLPPFPEPFEREIKALSTLLPHTEPALLQRLLLDIGGTTEQRFMKEELPGLKEDLTRARDRLMAANCTVPAVEARSRYAWIRTILEGCIERPAERTITWTDKLDRFLTHRIWGSIVFLILMFLVFETIFVWATPLMALIDSGKEWLAEQVRDAMQAGPLQNLITDGVIKGVGSVLVFLPQIMILFGFIAVLEDCGYMARAAFLMDKIMARCGLNGKSFIPLLSSVACAVPGIMATRTIENRRDRLATILVAPLMTCSARLPLYMLLIGTFLGDPWWLPGVALFGMYVLGLVIAPLVALTLKRTLLRGATPVFVLEMPVFKRPQVHTVLRRMTDAGWAFVRRAGTMILASMILIWAMLYFPVSHEDSSYDRETASLRTEIDDLDAEKVGLEKEDPPDEARLKKLEDQIKERQHTLDATYGEWKRQSLLGRAGQGLEPAFRPLGWDWKIGMAALASFPAREVVVGTLGIIYNQGEVDPKSIREADNPGETPLGKTIHHEWSEDPERGKYRICVALSLMVFFALCCQCVSTLAVIRRETQSWSWPVFTFAYMTILAYVGALVVYQVGKQIVG